MPAQGPTPSRAGLSTRPASTPERQWPLLHNIHGGPHGVNSDIWHWRWNTQVFAAAGYVVCLRQLPRFERVGPGLRRLDPRELGRSARRRRPRIERPPSRPWLHRSRPHRHCRRLVRRLPGGLAHLRHRPLCSRDLPRRSHRPARPVGVRHHSGTGTFDRRLCPGRTSTPCNDGARSRTPPTW